MRASNIFRNLCPSLGSFSARPARRPSGLVCYRISNPSHSSRSAREGSHWPSLTHVSLNQSRVVCVSG